MKTRQRIYRVRYVSPTASGVELMTLAQLRTIAPPGYLETPQRPAFHLLVFGTGGQVRHVVDFREHTIDPGRAIWVRPGQVQRFDARGTGAAELVLFRPDFLIAGTRAEALAADRFGPVGYDLAGVPAPGLERARLALRHEHDAVLGDSEAGGAIRTETLRHLLSVLILRLAAAADEGRHLRTAETADLRLCRRFRDLLERDFAIAHDVEHYASALGYSTRTLSRATGAVAGQTPKQAIQERLALEAGRLLAHSTRPVSAVAAQLGFHDASNFATFFVRQTGMTPTRFRSRERA